MKKLIIVVVVITTITTSIFSVQWEDKLLPSSSHQYFWGIVTHGGEETVRNITLLTIYKKAGIGVATKSIITYNVLSSIFVKPLKKEVGRLRPDEKADSGGDRSSFPSGHSMSAFYCAYWLGKMYPNQKIFFLGGATLVGISRTQLRVHHPSDVLAGGLLGYYGSAILDYAIGRTWEKITKKEGRNFIIIPNIPEKNLTLAWQF